MATSTRVSAERDGVRMVPDLLERLERWRASKLCDDPSMPNSWPDMLRSDLRDAIAEIAHLRSVSGAVRDGMSFADIKRELGRRSA